MLDSWPPALPELTFPRGLRGAAGGGSSERDGIDGIEEERDKSINVSLIPLAGVTVYHLHPTAVVEGLISRVLHIRKLRPRKGPLPV